MNKMALILGSGFSTLSSLPATKKVNDTFLNAPDNSSIVQEIGINGSVIDDFMTKVLAGFWENVFGYNSKKPDNLPSLEDHFTAIDFAANSGHSLGGKYSPQKLRAIRRFSIHRIFDILDARYTSNKAIHMLFEGLNNNGKPFHPVITTNWDIVVEKHLQDSNIKYNYGINVIPVDRSPTTINMLRGGIPLYKLHGSSNWVYCESCRRIFAGVGKTSLHKLIFIQPNDFEIMGADKGIVDEVIKLKSTFPPCRKCNNNTLSCRPATFSYRKDFSLSHFGTIWEKAHTRLSNSDVWCFIGYSLPNADFELKHLLKSAQVAKKRPLRKIIAYLYDGRNLANRKVRQKQLYSYEEENARYKSFFGSINVEVNGEGLTNESVDKILSSLHKK